MFGMLLEACPSYEGDWKKFLTEYAADDPGPLSYVATTQFARHLSRVLAAGDVNSVRRVFQVLERFIAEGDPEVQELAVVGLIKNLQNATLHDGTKPSDYQPFLLTQSARWWEKVRTFWMNGHLLTED
jgi:hypothetical protein